MVLIEVLQTENSIFFIINCPFLNKRRIFILCFLTICQKATYILCDQSLVIPLYIYKACSKTDFFESQKKSKFLAVAK